MSGVRLQRGVVVVDFTPTVPAAQIRPALIVQNDRDNQRTNRTIVAQITSNLRRSHEDTHLLIDTGHADWNGSGTESAISECGFQSRFDRPRRRCPCDWASLRIHDE